MFIFLLCAGGVRHRAKTRHARKRTARKSFLQDPFRPLHSFPPLRTGGKVIRGVRNGTDSKEIKYGLAEDKWFPGGRRGRRSRSRARARARNRKVYLAVCRIKIYKYLRGVEDALAGYHVYSGSPFSAARLNGDGSKLAAIYAAMYVRPSLKLQSREPPRQMH